MQAPGARVTGPKGWRRAPRWGGRGRDVRGVSQEAALGPEERPIVRPAIGDRDGAEGIVLAPAIALASGAMQRRQHGAQVSPDAADPATGGQHLQHQYGVIYGQ